MQQVFLNSLSDIEVIVRKVIQEEFGNLIPILSSIRDPPQNESEPLISKGQLAIELQISNPTLSKILRNKNIKYYKVGRRIKFKKSEVLNSLNNKK